MPRNGAGTFSVINPIVVGALRSSSAVNANFADAGAEITNSLPINGEAGMSGQFKATDGSALAPGITFDLDTNVGFRRSAIDEMGWVAGGQDRATMDANGKLTLAGGLAMTGALAHTSGQLGPQTLAGAGAARATLRRTENDTTERELASYQAGSGTGAKGSLREVGGGANDIATMRFYVNDVLTFQWTGALFTHSVDTRFGAAGIRGDTDGFLDFPEITAPSSPSANVARAYARDDSGTTRLYYKDASGSEQSFQPPMDRQAFTVSGTWTRPAQGQTTALVETWSGGGGGGTGGGGGGGAYSRKVIAIASVSAAVSVTVGGGGTAGSGSTSGGVGGSSSFGAYLATFGGGGGGSSGSVACGGGGGGGSLSAGITAVSSVPGDGGSPLGFISVDQWGDAIASAISNANPFGGGGGGDDGGGGVDAGAGFFGGGGGGGETPVGGGGDGGTSYFGGGGGGGYEGGVAGSSNYGGAGGTGGLSTGGAGSAPGGGGGGGATLGGVGARGEVRVTCW